MFSADPRDGFPRDSSLIVSLLSVAGFSVPITESRDEDAEEVGEDDVEKLVDKPGTTSGTEFDLLRLIFLPFLVRCWSRGKYTHDPRRASPAKELRVFLQEASLPRISPII